LSAQKYKGNPLMAHYEHLAMYKKVMEVAVYFEKIVKNFNRYHKYAHGQPLNAIFLP